MKQITINDSEVGAWIAGLDLIYEKTNKFGELYIIGKDADLSELPLKYSVIKFFCVGVDDKIEADCISSDSSPEKALADLMDRFIQY
jgi:hypothetical protein